MSFTTTVCSQSMEVGKFMLYGQRRFYREIESEDFYKDIADLEIRFDTRAYLKDSNRLLTIRKYEKFIDIMKREFVGKIMKDFVALRVKMYAYRRPKKKVNDKHCKSTKKCVVSASIFEGYKTCSFDGKTTYREQALFDN